MTKYGASKFKYLGNVGNRFQKPANTNTLSVGPGLVSSTHIFFGKWVKKRHLLTLNTKLQLQLTIRTALVQDIRLTTEKYVCTVKDFKTNSKSINQIRTVLMP